ncbi:MAG: M81 family metallopeptidase [Alphaproteobacteria bacterium]|nr:M81 family metallopeptidase [Alphaproteobacteria bacterium]
MTQRFVVAVMRHETNTFSPVPTPVVDFGRIGPTDGPAFGDEALRVYRDTNNPVAAYIDLAEAEGAEIVFPVAANAHPSAPAPDAIIDLCVERISEAVTAGCDALFLDLHGAMVTQGYDDGEGLLLRRIREISPELPIALALDFHTNLTSEIVDNATIIAGYRTYPHIDMYETGDRAGRTLLRAMKGEISPFMVWHSLPVLTHMNRHAPSMEPMKSMMAKAIAAESDGRVLNASIFGCFPLADIPHVGLSAIVVGDKRNDPDQAERLLYDILGEGWDRREEFIYPVEPVETSITDAKSLAESEGDGPIILADHGENTGSGGSQDVMAVLQEVMRQGLTNVVAGPFCDPTSVQTMVDAGVGTTITLLLGGKTDTPSMDLKGEPLEVTGTIRRITDGAFTVTGPMFTGVKMNIGRCAVLDTGDIEIVVSEGRYEPFDTGCFTHAGIDPTRKSFVLIKSRQHFRAGFEPMSKGIVLVSGPGCCSSDYSLFPWKNLRRPVYPLDPDVESNLPTQS